MICFFHKGSIKFSNHVDWKPFKSMHDLRSPYGGFSKGISPKPSKNIAGSICPLKNDIPAGLHASSIYWNQGGLHSSFYQWNETMETCSLFWAQLFAISVCLCGHAFQFLAESERSFIITANNCIAGSWGTSTTVSWLWGRYVASWQHPNHENVAATLYAYSTYTYVHAYNLFKLVPSTLSTMVSSRFFACISGFIYAIGLDPTMNSRRTI